MKILLVNPPARRFVRVQYPSFPLGLGYIASALIEKGHHVEIYDAEWSGDYVEENLDTKYPLTYMAKHWHRYFDALEDHDHWIWREVQDVIRERDPHVLGVTCRALDLASARIIAGMAKRINPSMVVVFGGPATSTCVDSIMQDENIDFAVRGEGEITMTELAEVLQDPAGDLHTVNGISFLEGWKRPTNFGRSNDASRMTEPSWERGRAASFNVLPAAPTALLEAGAIVNTAERARIDDISTLPHPAREALLFRDQLPPRKVAHMMGEMVTSRGCPFPCTFCAVNTVWGSRKSRMRRAEEVVGEIIHLKETYGSHLFTFWDDLFVQSRKRTVAICELLIDQDADIEWICLVRANTIDDELLALMKRAGCVQVQMGVESGSKRILAEMDKLLTLEQIRNGAEMIKRAGLSFHCFLIMGMPGETREEIEQTMAFIDDFQPDVVEMSVFSPYPGTPQYKSLASKGLVTEEDGLTADFLNVNKCYAAGFTLEEFRAYALNNLKICDEHNHRMAQKNRARKASGPPAKACV